MIAVITGAARGIGAGIARRLHAKGATVVLVGLEPERLEALAAQLDEAGEGRATWYEADVTDMVRLQVVADDLERRFGGIDVLVANAGIHFIGGIESSPVEQFERVLDVNLYGVWRTNRAMLPLLVARRGYVVNIASAGAAAHLPLMGSYAATKAAVEAFTNCLRTEMAPKGVGVGCAYFSFVETDLVRRSFEHPATQTVDRMLPAFFTKAAPLDAALDALERGIAKRSARLWAPRTVISLLRHRWLVQRFVERRALKHGDLVAQALEIASAEAARSEGAGAQHSLLGIAVEAGSGDQS